MAKNGQKWLKIVGIGQIWMEMNKNGLKLMEMAKIFKLAKIVKMVKIANYVQTGDGTYPRFDVQFS